MALRFRLATRNTPLLACLLALALLSGCAASPDGPPQTDTTNVPSTEITDQQRIATLDAVGDKLATLAAPTPDERRQELLNYLRSRSEFAASGINEEDGSLWARFTDGRLLLFPIVIADELPDDFPGTFDPPDDDGAQENVAGGPPAELPDVVQARFLSGGDPPGTANAIGYLQNLVTSRGYRLAPNAGTGDLDDLMQASGDGIFYFGGHGGQGFTSDGGRAYAVTTNTRISLQNESKYLNLWKDGSIAYGFVINSLLHPYASSIPPNTWPNGQRPEDYYGFTAKFVELHMQDFADGSLVYIAACSSFDPGMRDAFLARKAGVYFGWTGLVDPLSDGTASAFLFDRLLGTNTTVLGIPRENPRQRPFDYLSVYADMGSKNLVDSKTTYKNLPRAQLLYKAGFPEAGLLAPSIKYMDVDEQNALLTLTGMFGTEPGEVKMNGVPLDIDSWGKERIRAYIDENGPKAAGNVVVWSKGRKSNARQLTDWNPTFNWEFISGSGTRRFDGELYLHFRGDVGPYREEAGQAPKYRTVPFLLAANSYGSLTATGVDGNNKWEGTATISNRITGGSQNLMDGIGEIATETPDVRMAFFVIVEQGTFNVDMSTNQSTPLVWAWAKDEGPLSNTNPLPAMHIGLDQNFGIVGETKREVPLPDVSAVLYWSDSSPRYAPIKGSSAVVARLTGRRMNP